MIHESKFEGSWKEDPQQENIDQKVYKSVTFDVASGQPPNYVQTMRMQRIIPQQTNQYQHGYSLFSPDQQQQLNPTQPNSTQQLQDAVHQQNVQSYHSPAPMRAQPQPQTQSSITESDPMQRQKTEDLKKKLKRKIPEEN